MKKSIGWISKLDENEKSALFEYAKSFYLVRDFGGEFIQAKSDWGTSMYEFHIEESGLKYSTTLQELRTGLSTFLEGWTACKKSIKMK